MSYKGTDWPLAANSEFPVVGISSVSIGTPPALPDWIRAEYLMEARGLALGADVDVVLGFLEMAMTISFCMGCGEFDFLGKALP
jgi:hypothetical protein